jgi:phospholipase/carboxylesterase
MAGNAHEEGRLQARPVAEATEAAPVGLRSLDLAATRDGYLYLPATYRAKRPAPLAL